MSSLKRAIAQKSKQTLRYSFRKLLAYELTNSYWSGSWDTRGDFCRRVRGEVKRVCVDTAVGGRARSRWAAGGHLGSRSAAGFDVCWVVCVAWIRRARSDGCSGVGRASGKAGGGSLQDDRGRLIRGHGGRQEE